MRQYEDSKSTQTLITVASNSTYNIKTNKTIGNRNGKKNKCMDISSDKIAKSHTRRLGHVFKRETLRQKLNLFKSYIPTPPFGQDMTHGQF